MRDSIAKYSIFILIIFLLFSCSEEGNEHNPNEYTDSTIEDSQSLPPLPPLSDIDSERNIFVSAPGSYNDNNANGSINSQLNISTDIKPNIVAILGKRELLKEYLGIDIKGLEFWILNLDNGEHIKSNALIGGPYCLIAYITADIGNQLEIKAVLNNKRESPTALLEVPDISLYVIAPEEQTHGKPVMIHGNGIGNLDEVIVEFSNNIEVKPKLIMENKQSLYPDGKIIFANIPEILEYGKTLVRVKSGNKESNPLSLIVIIPSVPVEVPSPF